MYGLGIYLADAAKKSHRYVSQPTLVEGGRKQYRILVCSVLGRALEVQGHLRDRAAMHDVPNVRHLADSLSEMVEPCRGCRLDASLAEQSDLLFAKGLGGEKRAGYSVENNEFVAFHPYQCLPKYEITYEIFDEHSAPLYEAPKPLVLAPGRAQVGELISPQAGGRVHFSGCLMWDKHLSGWCSETYVEDQYSEFVGVGRYPSNKKAFPKAIATTFDSVAVDAGTRVRIYSKPNFKGEVLWDKVGPAIVCNVAYKTQHKGRLFSTWQQPLNTIFTSDVREFSSSDMHGWANGSVIIEDGQAIPRSLDAIEEYKSLSNARRKS